MLCTSLHKVENMVIELLESLRRQAFCGIVIEISLIISIILPWIPMISTFIYEHSLRFIGYELSLSRDDRDFWIFLERFCQTTFYRKFWKNDRVYGTQCTRFHSSLGVPSLKKRDVIYMSSNKNTLYSASWIYCKKNYVLTSTPFLIWWEVI